ncbi:hypothetical protein KSS87_011148 [Heliosperma pusillum]|nr:hypothetical protein KSS87_011148 [Heliosperma pusillum]
MKVIATILQGGHLQSQEAPQLFCRMHFPSIGNHGVLEKENGTPYKARYLEERPHSMVGGDSERVLRSQDGILSELDAIVFVTPTKFKLARYLISLRSVERKLEVVTFGPFLGKAAGVVSRTLDSRLPMLPL